MGLFVYLRGSFECVRCRRTSEGWIQTKLLRSEPDNYSRCYGVGDREVIDGLADYYPLHPWNDSSPLVVAVGDWDCDHCRLNRQWAKATFEIERVAARLVGTITKLTGLLPVSAAALDGIHFVEADLGELSWLWDVPKCDWHESLARWQQNAVAERGERVAAGFRGWCQEVAGVELPP